MPLRPHTMMFRKMIKHVEEPGSDVVSFGVVKRIQMEVPFAGGGPAASYVMLFHPDGSLLEASLKYRASMFDRVITKEIIDEDLLKILEDRFGDHL